MMSQKYVWYVPFVMKTITSWLGMLLGNEEYYFTITLVT